MLARYPGKCKYCGKPIEVGKDEYDIETKTNWHHSCHESQPPGPEQFALAEQLGFVADIPEPDWIRANWILRKRLTLF